jgi:hypothetical protein
MKSKKLKLLTIFLLLLPFCTIMLGAGCEKDDNDSSKTGNVVFYTNAQAMLNCGPFNVDVYIENDSVGSISEPYVDDTYPDCINSTMTVKLENKVGIYNYTARMDCGQYGEWKGELEILTDSCSYVFLDINNCNPKND